MFIIGWVFLYFSQTRCLYDSVTNEELVACLKSINPSALLQSLPWNSWLNPHLRDLPTKGENTAMLPIVDGTFLLLN